MLTVAARGNIAIVTRAVASAKGSWQQRFLGRACGPGHRGGRLRLGSTQESSPAIFTGLAGGLEFAVALGTDQGGAPFQFIFRSEVANRTVKPDGIVMGHVTADYALGILEREWSLGTDRFTFQAFMPAFEFAVALRIKRALW